MDFTPLEPEQPDKSLVDPCQQQDCGRQADEVDATDPALTGWTLAGVLGSREPPRWYCCPRCATRGIARMHAHADRRTLPAPKEGP